MENYYEKLGVDPNAPLEEIQELLEVKRQDSRKWAKVAHKRAQATALKDLVVNASAVFKTAEARAEYDRKLKADLDARVESQPIADEDYYELLGLPPIALPDQIVRKVAELEAKDSQSERAKIIRDVLLNPEKKTEYDKLLAAKKAYDKQKLSRTPVPLLIGEQEVTSLSGLEEALDASPDPGMELFLNGEIAAWAEWSLGKRNFALQIQEIAADARQSDTPFLERDQMLRYINRQRPLVMYDKGGRPGQGTPPVIKELQDIVQVAEKNRRLAVDRLDYILDWISRTDHSVLLDKLDTIQPERSPSVQLERLLYLIQPDLPAPQVVIGSLTDQKIDFGEIGRLGLSSPKSQFSITRQGRGYLYGEVKSMSEWVKIEPLTFEGDTTSFEVSLNRGKLESGKDSVAAIEILAMDGRTPSIKIDVLVHQKTLGQSIKGLFGRK